MDHKRGAFTDPSLAKENKVSQMFKTIDQQEAHDVTNHVVYFEIAVHSTSYMSKWSDRPLHRKALVLTSCLEDPGR